MFFFEHRPRTAFKWHGVVHFLNTLIYKNLKLRCFLNALFCRSWVRKSGFLSGGRLLQCFGPRSLNTGSRSSTTSTPIFRWVFSWKPPGPWKRFLLRKRETVPSLFEVQLFFNICWFYTTLKAKEGCFWGVCFFKVACVPYLSMVDFQVQWPTRSIFRRESRRNSRWGENRSVIPFDCWRGFCLKVGIQDGPKKQ